MIQAKQEKQGINDYQPKILIVDDKTENLLALEVLLKPLGAELFRASSGNEAISLTLKQDFSLVLLDVQMPEMDGFEVAELLHSRAETEHLPIIFISAIYSGNYYKVKGVESGAVDFIEKPIVPEILIGKVKIFLELDEHRRNLLRKSFEGTVENISDGVLIIDRTGIVQMANPAAERMFSDEAGSLIGRPFAFPLLPGELKEVTLKRCGADTLHVEYNTSSMLWHGEKVSVVSLRDVTDRKLALEALNKSLKALDEKNLELQSFTYSVSHDLRSPLVTIGGYSGLLEQIYGDLLPGEALGFVDEINNAAHHMDSLLEQLLALSRVGRTDEPFSEVPLGLIIETAVTTIRLNTDTDNIEIRVEDDFPAVFGNFARLSQVVQNLVGNAIKYMGEQSSPLIEIGVTETPSGLALFVKDNGPGIPPKYHDKIFGLFSRLHNDDDGSGVGLAVVRKIVNLHEGKIWVESDGDGNGSTFWVKLPFLEPEKQVSSEN